jgi:hypothetical protein
LDRAQVSTFGNFAVAAGGCRRWAETKIMPGEVCPVGVRLAGVAGDAGCEVELNTYKEALMELLAQDGDYVLIEGAVIIGVYDTYGDAV